jgi:hypothetical protein
MKTLCIVLAIGAATFPLFCQAEDFDVRTGSWQITMTTTMNGMMIPKAELNSMPPEQRAKVEAMLRARSGQANTRTTTECLTRQDLDRGRMMKSENEKCTRKVLAQNARHLDIEETCPAPEATKSHFVVNAASATSYSASVDVMQAEGGKVHVTMNGRWLGATCQKSAK